MTDRGEDVVDAAVRVVLRYGVKRTTMNDIAAEAGIARQTLYTVFSNKDEVLRTTIRLFADRSLAAIEAEAAEVDTLGERLDIVFAHMVVRPFEMLRASPDADDIISGFNQAGRDELSIANERYAAAIEGILAPFDERIAASGMNVRQLADFVRTSAKGFKHDARDKAQLSELLASLKALVLAVAEPATEQARV